MSDYVILSIDRIATPGSLPAVHPLKGMGPSAEGSSSSNADISSRVVDLEEGAVLDGYNENDPLLILECRICQEEDNINNLESPCACSGSLKYAHRKCVQRWCNEKGDVTCEICHQPYKPGYTAPPSVMRDDIGIDIDDSWTIDGTPLHLHDPRILAMAASEHHLLGTDYDEFSADINASGASFFRSVALILMALLLLRHAMSLTTSDEDDDPSAFLSVFMLRAVGFLLSCYIMAWAISMLQRRRQRQESAAIAASEVAFMFQAGQRGGMHFTMTTSPSPTLPESSSPPPTIRTEEAATPRPESPQ